MRNDVLVLLNEQREEVINQIDACELLMSECHDDPRACAALRKLQAKYEAVADEIEVQLEVLR